MASRRDKPLGGYVRVSSVGSRSETLISPEDQAKRIRAYADAHGIEVELAEPELDVSGGRASRPILDGLIARVEAGELGGIIVAQLDRFSRMRIGDALRTIEHIESVGGRVVAVAEAFDVGTPEGRLARNMFLSIAQMQLDRYKESFDRSKRRALEQGIYGGPRVPLGYTCTRRRDGGTGKLEIDPETAPLVRKGFEARAAGKSWVEVAKIIGRDSAGSKKIIENPIYLGELHVGDLPPNREAHPAIVSREVWEAAQISHPRPPRSVKPPALLGGLVRCAGCSRKMAATGYGYRCKVLHGTQRCPDPATISNKIEAMVEQAVVFKMRNIKAKGVANTEELDAAKDALRKAEDELQAFMTATEASEVGAEVFAGALRDRSDAVERARQAVGELQAASGTTDTSDLFSRWPTLTVEQKRHLLRFAIGAVWVRSGKRDFANRIKICDPIETGVKQGTSAPIGTVKWDDLPVSVGLLGTQE
jgi:DNA invertase Pin-like site-specific DNA recombinase